MHNISYIQCLFVVIFLIDPYNVSITLLIEPREDFVIRLLDYTFVDKLKLEILERCSTFVKPIIAIVREVTREERILREDFDKRKLENQEYICLESHWW